MGLGCRMAIRMLIFFCVVVCMTLIMPHFVFAEAFSPFENASHENSIRTVPALQADSSGNAQSIPPQNLVPPVNPVMNAWGNPSPLSVENSEAPLVSAPRTFTGELSEQEVSALVDNVFSNMARAENEENFSEMLTLINREDYVGLVSSLQEDPNILDEFIESLQKVSEGYGASSDYSGYLNEWIKQAYELRERMAASQAGTAGSTDMLVEAAVRLYEPIAKRVSEVTTSLEEASRASGNSEGLLKSYSVKAKEFVLSAFSRAQTNLANGMLSSPLEATAFAAEINPVKTSSATLDQTAAREMTIAELYVKGRNYLVVDSVYIGKDFIYAQKMLHPPANLHPYLKWLLYTRNLTPRMVENYLATREAVGAIYAQAKEGRGNIRYRGKVYGAFLPFAETAAGNYELVKTASAE